MGAPARSSTVGATGQRPAAPWRVRVLFMGLSLIVAFVLAELFCAAFLPAARVTWDILGLHTRVGSAPRVIKTERCWGLAPGQDGQERVRHSYDYRFHTNALGLRHGEIGEKRPGVTRVLVLGDSQVFGVGVNETETIPAVMQARLDAKGPGRWEVINAGVYGYDTFDERCLFEGLAPMLKPDLVIVTVFADNTVTPEPGNDLSQNFAVLERRRTPDGPVDRPVLPTARVKFPRLTRHSHFYNHLADLKRTLLERTRGWMGRAPAVEREADRANRRAAWQATREQIDAIAQAGRAANPRARTLIAYLPGVRTLASNDQTPTEELTASHLAVVSLADTLRTVAAGNLRALTFELDGHYTGRVDRAVGERLAGELLGGVYSAP